MKFVANDKSIKVVTNRVFDEKEGDEIFEKLSIVVSKFLNVNLEYLGYIVQGNEASKAVIEQNPVSISYANSTISRCISDISSRLIFKDSIVAEKNGIAKVFLDFIKTKRQK